MSNNLEEIQYRGSVPNLLVSTQIEPEKAVNLTASQDKPQKLDSTEPLYKIVEKVVSLALRILDDQHGRKSMVEVAQTITSRWAEDGKTYYDPQGKELEEWVNHYLACIRDNFPHVYIKRGLPDRVEPKWLKLGRNVDKNAYNAKQGGIISLPMVVLYDIEDAEARYHQDLITPEDRPLMHRNLATWYFTLAVGVCSAVAHLLVRFLGPSIFVDVPCGLLSVDGTTPEERRAGPPRPVWRAFEERLWNVGAGRLVVYEDPEDRLLDHRQAGIVCIKDQEKDQERVDQKYLERFMQGVIEFPAKFDPYSEVPTGRTMAEWRREIYPFL